MASPGESLEEPQDKTLSLHWNVPFVLEGVLFNLFLSVCLVLSCPENYRKRSCGCDFLGPIGPLVVALSVCLSVFLSVCVMIIR